MVRAIAADSSERKVIEDIAKYGWHVVNIMAEGELPEYSFTVGLFHTYGHPEFIIFGLPSKVAHQILQIAVDAIRSGHPLELSEATDALLENYACCFIEVSKTDYYDHVGFCRWYYEGDAFPLYQIVWPSRAGHFPWHPECSASFRQLQPILAVAHGT